MSKYTTEVRYICEMAAGSKGDMSVKDVLKNSWNKVFDFDFPIWDEEYRSVLCTKILKHYYTREIGLETVGLWKLKLDTKMNEIMPYFNERYKSTQFNYDPIHDVDYTRLTNGDEKGKNSKDGSSKSKSKNLSLNSGESRGVNRFSDTPQGGLEGIEDNQYLTSATINDSKGVNNSVSDGSNDVSNSENGNFETTRDFVEHVFGKMSGNSYGKLIREYRDNLINIDNEIIDELKDLFMLLW